MKGTISAPTTLIGTAIVVVVFAVAILLLAVNTVKSTTDIELVSLSRMYGDIISDFLINSPNWYSIERVITTRTIVPKTWESCTNLNYDGIKLGYECEFTTMTCAAQPYTEITGRTSYSEMTYGMASCGKNGATVLRGTGTLLTGDSACYGFPGSSAEYYYSCSEKIPFNKDFYLHSDCGCLAWEENVDGQKVVHPGIVDLNKATKNVQNCANHPVSFCMDAAGYYWRAKLTYMAADGKTTVTKEFGWRTDLVTSGDATIKKVVGVYDPVNPGRGIQPGKLEFTIKASDLRRKITISS